MGSLLEIILTIIISAAVIAAVWLVYGRLVTPVRAGKGESLYAVIYAQGVTPELARTVEGLLWLVSTGKANMELIIIDGGMDPESRKMAEILVRDYAGIRFCRQEDLPKLFTDRTEEGFWREEVSE